MNIKRIIGKADQQKQEATPAAEDHTAAFDSFDGMSPGWALQWDLTTLSERDGGVEKLNGSGLRNGGSFGGSDDQ